MAAVKGGRIREVSSLLNLGANVDGTSTITDEEVSLTSSSTATDTSVVVDSPLFAAVRNGHVDVACLLLDHGANPKCKTRDGGNRGLHLAAMTGLEEMCRLLLVAEVGNDNESRDYCHFLLTCTNENNMTAFDIAVERGFLALAEKLKNGTGLLRIISTSNSFEDDSSEDFSSSSNVDDLDYVEEIRDRFLALGRKTEGRAGSSFSEGDVDDVHYNPSFHEEDTGSVSAAIEDQIREGGRLQSNEDILALTQNNEYLGDVPLWDQSGYSEGKVPSLSSQISMESATCGKSEDEDVSYDPAQQSTSLGSQLEPLRALVEHLHEKNLALEEAEKVMQMQSKDTEIALSIMEKKCENLEKERDNVQRIVEETLDGVNLPNKSLDDLEVIEARLRKALRGVILQKEIIIRNKLSSEEEKMTCVICQMETKTVLLMPCRHMCVCKGCSLRHEMDRCPMCRQPVEDKIDVYA